MSETSGGGYARCQNLTESSKYSASTLQSDKLISIARRVKQWMAGLRISVL